MTASSRLALRLASRRRDGERGASTIETVIIFPAVLGLIFLIVQAGFYVHAREAALHAANVATTAASAEGASDSAGWSAATAFANRAGALDDLNIDVTRTGETVTATVTGRAPSLIPGVQWPQIRQSSTAALERYVP